MATERGVDGSGNTNPTRLQTEAEFESLVVEYNNTAAPYPSDSSVAALFAAQAARTPDHEAIRLGEQSLTYRELNDRSNQVAAHLHTIGVGRGQLVVLYMEHSIEVVCAMFGVLKAGAAYVPIDVAIPKERFGFILRDVAEGCGGPAPVVVTQSRLTGRVPGGATRVVTLDADFASVDGYPVTNPVSSAVPDDLAYAIYTSGSTGTPKGVLISHRSLVNYVWWAIAQYSRGEQLTWPLFSSLAFDLTVTSIFTPLLSGGRIVVYREDPGGHSMVVFKVIEDGLADIIKLTPAHLAMIQTMDLGATRVRKIIVGGEDFKTELAQAIADRFVRPVEIVNEYGPTEATVGCMIHRFERGRDGAPSVPIGVPAANTRIYVLDEHLIPVPSGVIGEMYIAGDGLARGYFNRPDLTAQAFLTVEDPRQKRPFAPASGTAPDRVLLYKTGDIARWGSDDRLEFLGRADHQVKIGGFRIELGEIEACLLKHPDIRQSVVEVIRSIPVKARVSYCSRCGLASNFPGTTYDSDGVCHLCRAYDTYADKAQAYFKTREEFDALVMEMKAARTGDYDCLVLYSGGKDSTYMLFQLCALGLKPLVFSLDNGFISKEAIANIQRNVALLGVDLVFGRTPHMNEIFVDSLNHFANVCNGCFKTIYTLATNLALEKGIRHIVTGLSRGQFFETRLTEEVFRREDFDVARLDALVLEARKAYHHREDAVSCHLAVDVLRGDGVLDEIRFVDFYRYWDVSLEELYDYLHKHASWVRPSDTGRSTNCLINELGIYLHKKQRGFHNYALPYSWDVRLGQKTRKEAMEELEDEIDEARVTDLMNQVGYVEPPRRAETGIDRLVAYFVSDKPLTVPELREHLAAHLPEYMLPTNFVRLDSLPLTSSGKVDRTALPPPSSARALPASEIAGPRNEIERSLVVIWTELLNSESIGIHDEFFELGGHSLLAMRAVSRIRDTFCVDIPLEVMFAKPTIAGLAEVLTELKDADRSPAIGVSGSSAGPIARQARRSVARPTSPGEGA